MVIGMQTRPSASAAIRMTLRLAPSTARRAEILTALRSLTGPIAVQRGCQGCRVFQELPEENALTFVEEWASDEDFERHVRSREHRSLLAIMEACEGPELRFDHISGVEGLELLERLSRSSGRGEPSPSGRSQS
jgi:quinol monooxygenase YgiN